MPFVVRSRGFWFTGAYHAPTGRLLTRVRRVYATREAAEDVVERLHRDWLRAEPDLLRSQLWTLSQMEIEAATPDLLRLFPGADENEVWSTITDDATDDQLDRIVLCASISLAEVHEIDDGQPLPDEAPDPDHEYGAPALYEALTRYDPAPWPPPAPTPGELHDSDAAVQVAWDRVASCATADPVARAEARRRAFVLGLDWHDPVHRALVSFAPDADALRALLPAADPP